MKSRLVLLFTLLPGLAAAQDPADLELSGGYAQIDELLINDPFLNVEACYAETPEPITIDVGYTGNDIFLDDMVLRVWLVSSNETDCTGQIPGNGDADYIGDVDLALDASFLTSGALIRIPDHLEDATGAVPTLDSHSLLERYTACPEGADSPVTLCIGLDVDEDNTIDEGLTVEPHGWVRYDIDTERPPKPNPPTVRPLDARLRVTATVSGDDAIDDIDEYQGFARPEPEDEADRGIPCDEWPEGTPVRMGSLDVALGDTSATFEISGNNGVTYEVCVYAVDNAGNFSEPSDIATGTPRQECDFIECYPAGFLEPGCTATGATPLAGIFVLLLALRRALERRA